MQRFKIIYFSMGPWDVVAMILTEPWALGMGHITDFLPVQLISYQPMYEDQ